MTTRGQPPERGPIWREELIERRAVVVAPAEVAVRFEPTPTGTAHFQAKPGTVLRVVTEREGWTQVARGDGLRGWVERAAVAPL